MAKLETGDVVRTTAAVQTPYGAPPVRPDEQGTVLEVFVDPSSKQAWFYVHLTAADRAYYFRSFEIAKERTPRADHSDMPDHVSSRR